ASRCLTILGSTGSIGVNTLKVIAAHRERFCVHALTANRNVALLAEQCRVFAPKHAVVADAGAAGELQRQLRDMGVVTEVSHGSAALAAAASAPEVDTVMAAIVGGAGLLPTLAAARSGKKILLANKEALVMAGELFLQTARQSGAPILPIDSEHNAVFQCLPMDAAARFTHADEHGLDKIVLTASGGPFRNLAAERFADVTPEQACAHPNWVMGRKISVDSATLVNKGLELIEASYLFEIAPSRIEVVVHPQSIVHSLVHYRDGSVLAQLGNPDMRTPIAHALAWPQRIDAGVATLDLVQLGRLEFHAPDLVRFRGLALGRAAAEARGAAPNVFNAANEVAVAAFLGGQLGFAQIPVIIAETLERADFRSPASLDDVVKIDAETRALTADLLVKMRQLSA
ncbi:MAG TPA: 1-deoxy-D-xylulose-5-phosphate reductoisomerase, partial [Candidatus Acidoferrum sp.]|nr:1-deoxy-D-xylulose-5-phosphate reductoisomerase [Candidatus Acidoferrum sp.]